MLTFQTGHDTACIQFTAACKRLHLRARIITRLSINAANCRGSLTRLLAIKHFHLLSCLLLRLRACFFKRRFIIVFLYHSESASFFLTIKLNQNHTHSPSQSIKIKLTHNHTPSHLLTITLTHHNQNHTHSPSLSLSFSLIISHPSMYPLLILPHRECISLLIPDTNKPPCLSLSSLMNFRNIPRVLKVAAARGGGRGQLRAGGGGGPAGLGKAVEDAGEARG